MKIYKYIEIDTGGNVIDEISYDYQGDIFLCKGGGGSSETVSEPSDWAKYYMPKVADEAWWYKTNQPMSYYPGQTYAGFTPEQTQAQKLTTERAMGGSPLLGQSQDFVSGILSGTGEGFKQMLETGLTKVIPGAATGAIGGGMGNSSAWNMAMGQAIGDIVGNYGMQAAQLAPALAKEDYYDIGKLAAVGEEKQAMEQTGINEAIARHEFGQLEPWQRLGMFTNLISGDWGGLVRTQTSGGGK